MIAWTHETCAERGVRPPAAALHTGRFCTIVSPPRAGDRRARSVTSDDEPARGIPVASLPPLRAGECALLDCRRGCGHATGEPPWRLKWIHFDGPGAAAFGERWRERAGGPVLRATSPERYRRAWEEVWAAVSSEDDPIRDLRANEGLASLCTLLMQDALGTEPDRRAERLAAVRSWIEAHCAEEITLERLSAVAHLNKYTLVREFRARYGVPPMRALAQARVSRAKRLLRFTDDTVETIGAAVGVPDPNYFARLFRRVEGLSPSAFRERWRE